MPDPQRDARCPFAFGGVPLPKAARRNPCYREELPESPYLCPVCGDSHVRTLASRAAADAPLIVTCAAGHRYEVSIGA